MSRRGKLLRSLFRRGLTVLSLGGLVAAGCTSRDDAPGASDGADAGPLFPEVRVEVDTRVDSTTMDTLPAQSDTTVAPDVDDVVTSHDGTVGGADTSSDIAASDSGGGLSPCGSDEVTLQVGLVPPTILILIDRSGSMYERWETTMSSVGAMIAATDGQVELGLMMFPLDRGCTTATGPQVPVGPGSANLIVDAMRLAGTGGSTPMGPATEAAKDYLLALRGAGEVGLVLVADGKPSDTCLRRCDTCDCDDLDGCALCGGTGASNCQMFTSATTCPSQGCRWAGETCYAFGAGLIECTQREVEIPIRELAAHGVRTWVVGFEGGAGQEELLRRLASSGGTLDAVAGGFFDAGQGAELGDILADVQTQMRACRAEVAQPPGYAFPAVRVDGVLVGRDASRTEGWDWVGPGELGLFGVVCDQARAGASVEVVYYCKP